MASLVSQENSASEEGVGIDDSKEIYSGVLAVTDET